MPAEESLPVPPPPPAFQPLLPDDPAEVASYRLFARLGSGGMGRVYLSYTPGGRPVALKVVRPEFAEDAEFRRRFGQEVANAQRIHGLYTAQVIDAGTTADAPWLVTAYVPGPSLQQVVREHGPLPVRTVLLLLGGIAEALQAIHSVAVVHRDLKPANVLVAADGPRVIDFGIARAADATALTGTGYRIGSPAFMAPEQAQGGAVTPATDVFALGALAAYVASGVQPFGEGPETAVLYRVVHEEPDLGAVPADLRELVLRCLAKAPGDRPAPAEIIETARNHPAVGGQLRFADDWLPAPVNTEITRRSDLPRTPPRPVPVVPTVPVAPPMPSAPPVATLPPVPTGPVPTGLAPTGLAPNAVDGTSGGPAFATGAVTAPLPAPQPTTVLPPHQAVAPAAAPTTPPAAGGRRGSVSWKTLLAVAVVMALGGTLAGVLLSQGDGKSNSASNDRATTSAPTTAQQPQQPVVEAPTTQAAGDGGDSPVAAPSTATDSPGSGVSASGGPSAWTPVVSKVELDIPASTYVSDAYRVDLTAGKLIASGTSAKWVLALQQGANGSQAGAFTGDGDDSSDFAVITDPSVTPGQCNTAIDTHPDSDLSFTHASAGRLLCIRDRSTHAVAIAAIEVADAQTGEVKLSVSTWQGSS
ncbi:serine/threonine-protein kinase [Kitasatospora viridis]|uniref:Serine/threonine protein kinase n=1 Tax=Kitasatospora viridis TaxID=281105 RepID=A0A561UF06_9ACTN|nr:serine/threonine-protein kinase [Kitasatospora viridis]TWF97946.1 serine/threonine protein kinase [Kitasatospora viridis]